MIVIVQSGPLWLMHGIVCVQISFNCDYTNNIRLVVATYNCFVYCVPIVCDIYIILETFHQWYGGAIL